jgi:fluoroquinolone transport system permease protein
MIKAAELLLLSGRIDWRSLKGDSFLLLLIAAPFVYALLIRLGLPYADAPLQQAFGMTAADLGPLLGAGLLMLAPSCAGVVVGFLLLDERDLNVMSAIRVTPCPPAVYLARRLFWPCALGTVVGLLAHAVSGLAAPPLVALIVLSLVASLVAPAMALMLSALASNKVQGLALLKVFNVIALVPVFAYFLDGTWRYVSVVLPTAWPIIGYWHALEGKFWLIDAVGGVVFLGCAIALLYRLFERRV